MAKDYYEVLGLTRNASPEEIEKAYKNKIWLCHPDRCFGDPKAAEQFKEVQAAYEALINKKTGQANFTHQKTTQRNSFKFTFEDVNEEFFGGSKVRGRNIQIRLEIELAEVYKGCTKQVKIKKRKRCIYCDGKGNSYNKVCVTCEGTGFRVSKDAPFMVQQTCGDCNGKGVTDVVRCLTCLGAGFVPEEDKLLNVTIPFGIGHGMSIRLAGEGEEPIKAATGIKGDVLVVVLVKPHPIFKREDATPSNLLVDVPVSYTQCVLGGKIFIPTLGESMEVQIPVGAQSNTRFRLKGKGLPDQRGKFGDLIATIKVESPPVISEDYKKALEELAKYEKEVITPKRAEWHKKLEAHNHEQR